MANAPAPANGAANENGIEAAQVYAALVALGHGTVDMLYGHVAQQNDYGLWLHLQRHNGFAIVHRRGHFITVRPGIISWRLAQRRRMRAA